MYKDGPDFSCVGPGVEEGILAIRSVVASKKCFSVAPAAAADDQSRLVSGYSYKIRSVFNELGIQAKRMTKRSLDLRGGIVIPLEPANG